MMHRAFRSGVLQTVVLVVLLALCLSGVFKAYSMTLDSAQICAADVPGQVKLVFSGMNLLRANAFYLDKLPVEDCQVERITYDECRVTLREDMLNAGEWYRLELGHVQWGFIRLMSNPIWIEWPSQ